ncbi:MAG: phage minor capsid protein [Ruminiclostridium sp.]
MTKLEAMALSEGLTRLVVGMETDLIKNIADFLAAGQAETSTALWKIKKLAELGALNKKNKRTIAEYAEIQPEMQQITLEAAAVKAVNQLEPGFRELVKEGVLKDAAEMPASDTMMRAVKMLGKQAASDLNFVSTTMLYKAKKAAEKVINDTAELANKQEFLDSLNKAAGKVVTGIESRQAAMRKCIGEMTEKGIPAFTDKLGREWTPEAYTNMCIRTTVAKTATETQMERMDDYGVNLVAVSSHIGARPLCAPYQGRIFDRNNGSGYTTDLNDKKIRYEAWSSTSYGKPAGLLGINCGHQIYPFIPGINVQRYFPYDDEENAEQYKKLQKQRQFEREVRAAKRECTALDTVGDKAGFDEAAVRLKEKQQRLKDYCSSNGLTYKPDRTATPGYGKSEAAKVTASYKKAVELEKAQLKLDIGNESSIIKSVKIPKEFIEINKYKNNFDEIEDFDINIVKTINDVIKKAHDNGEVFNFSSIEVRSLKGVYAKSLMVTDATEEHGFLNSRLILNKELFQGKTLDEINSYTQSLYDSNWWMSKNFEDLVNHEIFHAKLNAKNSYERLDACYDFLSDEKVTGLCRMVNKDKTEFLNEVYVTLCRGENVDSEYLKIYNKYVKQYLGD